MSSEPRVETYRLATSSGRHIRIATKVIFPDGRVVEFLDRMSKREAIKQARYQLEKHPEYFGAARDPRLGRRWEVWVRTHEGGKWFRYTTFSDRQQALRAAGRMRSSYGPAHVDLRRGTGATAVKMGRRGQIVRHRRDPQAMDIPKSMKAKKSAIERAIKALSQAEHLDHTERFAALKKIYGAADRLAHHARYKEGWDYAQSGTLEDDLRKRAREAHDQAETNYRAMLKREIHAAEERVREERRERMSTPFGAYQEELKLHRGGSRDPKKVHHHRVKGAPTFAEQRRISRKIRLLVREGKPPKQAAAIAYRMAGIPPRRRRRVA